MNPQLHPQKSSWKAYISEQCSLCEKRCDFIIRKTRYTATNSRHIEEIFGVVSSKIDKLVNIRTNRLNTTLHRGNGITLPLQSNTLPHDCTKTPPCHTGRPSPVHTCKIATKHKDFIFSQGIDVIWCILGSILIFYKPEIIHDHLVNYNSSGIFESFSTNVRLTHSRSSFVNLFRIPRPVSKSKLTISSSRLTARQSISSWSKASSGSDFNDHQRASLASSPPSTTR